MIVLKIKRLPVRYLKLHWNSLKPHLIFPQKLDFIDSPHVKMHRSLLKISTTVTVSPTPHTYCLVKESCSLDTQCHIFSVNGPQQDCRPDSVANSIGHQPVVFILDSPWEMDVPSESREDDFTNKH